MPDIRVGQLAPIVEQCGRHVLTVDFAGGYIAEYGGGNPLTQLNLGTPKQLQAYLEQAEQKIDELDDGEREVLQQGYRFARIAEHYRDAMLQKDEAAMALLECICLFRLGVDSETLTAIFTGEQAVEVSGRALAALSSKQLQSKLDWLVRMRIVESQPQANILESKILYSIHPAVRDGFLSGINRAAAMAGHEAVRKGLEVSLGETPGDYPSDLATLDRLEEIIHHTLQSDHTAEAWDFHRNRLGGFKNLGWRLGAYERGERICRAFADGQSPETLLHSVGFKPLPHGDNNQHAAARGHHFQDLNIGRQAALINEWALYLSNLGRLAAAANCHKFYLEIMLQNGNTKSALISSLNLCDEQIRSGRLYRSQKIITPESVDHSPLTPPSPEDANLAASYDGALATSEQALRLAELADDLEGSMASLVYHGYVLTLKGEIPAGLTDFREARVWLNSNPLLQNGTAIYFHSPWLLTRLRPTLETVDCLQELQTELLSLKKFSIIPHLDLLQAEIYLEHDNLSGADKLCQSTRNWAHERDAKNLLCYSSVVSGRIALSKASHVCEEGKLNGRIDATHCQKDPEREKYKVEETTQKTVIELLKRNKRRNPTNKNTARPWAKSTGQGSTIPKNIIRANDLRTAADDIEEGLRIARDCGFSLYHIDLLLIRSQLHLLRGNVKAAQNDIDKALDIGIPANKKTGQPELLASNHAACGYAWPIPAGLQLRAESLLLQAAQKLNTDSLVHAKASELPTDITSLIHQAKLLLQEALDLWQPLHDPDVDDQNFKLNGKEYNYKAAETYRIISDLESGMLTKYPITPIKFEEMDQQQKNLEETMSKRVHVALSFPGEHRPFVKEIASELVLSLSKEKVFYDHFYEAELARPNLDTYLQNIYHDDTELIVVFICEDYNNKEWCHLEARAIRDLIKKRRDDEIMFVRVDDGSVDGVFSIDGYVDAKGRSAQDVAKLICDRLALAKNH